MQGLDGLPYAYGKPGYLNGPFLAVGDPASFDALPPLYAPNEASGSA